MINSTSADNAKDFLSDLVGQPFQYGRMYQELGMYGLGFGPMFEISDCNGVPKIVCPYTVHVQSPFKIIWRKEKHHVEQYFANTPCNKFYTEIQPLIGLGVKRFALSDKNDLWIDLGDYWLVFITFEDNVESWRFFTPGRDFPHLVASNSWLKLEY